jgi:acetyl esterase/lipase
MKPVYTLALLLAATLLHARETPEESRPSSPKAQPTHAKPGNADEDAYPSTVPVPTHSEVRYGPHARNVLDFWQAKSDKPTPLVLVIHGGGWNSGSKERANRFADVKALLDAGISVAANNYRLIPQVLDEGVAPPVKAPMHDSARALQFLRSKAAEWNIDPARIAAAGGSAGACTSLWLAYHDDMADPRSDDPVARQSTRLMCIAVIGAQTTLDPKQAKEWIPNSRYGGHAFGKTSFAQALNERESILPWIAEYSPYALAGKDDPPVALFYPKAPAMGKNQADPTHSANFGIGLQERCKELGIACDVIYPGAADIKHPTPTAYLIARLSAPGKTPHGAGGTIETTR